MAFAAPVEPVPLWAGVVVVVLPEDDEGLFDVLGDVDVLDGVDAAAVDWFSSSSTSLASSALSVDCADDTDSLKAVVSSVPSVSPAVTCSPGVAVRVATCPPTWKEAAASLTGSTFPTTVMWCRCWCA